MSPANKVKGFVFMAVLMVTAVLVIIVSASIKDASIQPSYATSDTPLVTSPTIEPSVSIAPTLLRVKNQDVPLKIPDNKEVYAENSYLYTELTSKGVIGNISDTSATVYWLTEAPQQTLLRYGTDPQRLNLQAVGLSLVHIHEAKLQGLVPNTVYYFTGHAPIVDTLTTAGKLGQNLLTKKISGSFKNGSGQCLVRGFISGDGLSSAYVVSTSTTDNWQLSIGNIRNVDLSAYYDAKSTDLLELEALCVSDGKSLFSGHIKGALGELFGKDIVIPLSREN